MQYQNRACTISRLKGYYQHKGEYHKDYLLQGRKKMEYVVK